MGEVKLMISEAAKKLQVEAHVLRYWEEELGLHIGRTEMGHRYYTEDDIQLFLCIQKLKNEGILLRELKSLIPQLTALRQKKNEEKQKLEHNEGTTAPASESDKPSTMPRKSETQAASQIDEHANTIQASMKRTDKTQPVPQMDKPSTSSPVRDTGNHQNHASVALARCMRETATENPVKSVLAEMKDATAPTSSTFGTSSPTASSAAASSVASSPSDSASAVPAETAAVSPVSVETAAKPPTSSEMPVPVSAGTPAATTAEVIEVTHLEQVRALFGDVITEAITANNQTLEKNISRRVTSSVCREIDLLFQAQEHQEEEHYRKLDALIRQQQAYRKETVENAPVGAFKRLFT